LITRRCVLDHDLGPGGVTASVHREVGKGLVTCLDSYQALYRGPGLADIYEKSNLETNVGQGAASLGAAAVATVGAGVCEDYSSVPELHTPCSGIESGGEHPSTYRAVLARCTRIADTQADKGDWIEKGPMVGNY